ncbi:MAG: tRNA uridine-5-carboxymethylaminomethyl(34) synthesis GTPase MnmE [Chitinispirillales bacterium]|nr:tRNA uridine-5-carboxymethylaminomethyl(34) synthesis GTPase MnmE [Chitinispirillales bacterium]
MSTQTIAALSTPPGRGALAGIRVTGGNSHTLFSLVINEKEKFNKEACRKIGIYTIIGDDGNIIDEVTAIKYDAPRSFTGEHMVEIFCHGSPIITGRILDRLFNIGVHPAARGEFSRRALLNGKMDLLKAESIAGLIDSQTEKHLQSASMGYQGNQRSRIENYKRKIIGLLSDLESRIEFGEEDDVAQAQLNTKNDLEQMTAELSEELIRSERVKTFDEGIFVALAGPANAGKSSLFNEILGFDRSIIHDKPGTTRDIVSERISFESITIKLFDCAGIRETNDCIERKGIERSISALKDAHFVLWVTSADESMKEDEADQILEYKEKILLIINKIDIISPIRAAAGHPCSLYPHNTGTNDTHPHFEFKKAFCAKNDLRCVETSIREKINHKELFNAISSAIHGVTEEITFPEIILNDRHRRIITAVLNELRHSIAEFNREELSAHYLRNALNHLAEFSGHVTSDEVLDMIFEKFCIGK